jgi:transcriptional regulator with XRE-family HTH domain
VSRTGWNDRLRKSKKVSQAELAKLLNRPQSFVSKYESGERRLDIIETLLIVRALGIQERNFLLSLLRKLEGGKL